MHINQIATRLWHKLSFFIGHLESSYDHAVDTLSAQQLAPLLTAYPYLPHTSFSLRYSSMAYLLNDIIINNRKVVVEFGAGMTTVVLARFIKQAGLKDITLFSVEQDGEWLSIVERYLLAEAADMERVHLVHAELRECALALNGLEWYDSEKLRLLEAYRGRVDCVLVDGPKANRTSQALSRYPALPYLYSYLAPSCSVFLDDTNRAAEKSIVALWANKYGLNAKQLNSSFTRLGRGAFYRIK